MDRWRRCGLGCSSFESLARFLFFFPGFGSGSCSSESFRMEEGTSLIFFSWSSAALGVVGCLRFVRLSAPPWDLLDFCTDRPTLKPLGLDEDAWTLR